MTRIDPNTCATDLNDAITNQQLTEQGYTIRAIETWHQDGQSDSIILWDSPVLSGADLPY